MHLDSYQHIVVKTTYSRYGKRLNRKNTVAIHASKFTSSESFFSILPELPAGMMRVFISLCRRILTDFTM